MSISDKEILRIAKSDDWIMRKIWDHLANEEEKRILEQRELEKKAIIDNLAESLEKSTILSVEVLDYGNEVNPSRLQITTSRGIVLDHVINE